MTRRKPSAAVETAETVALLEVVEAEIAEEVEPGSSLALADPVFTMSPAEWAERYRAMVPAGRFRDEQADLLRRAKILDDVSPLDAANLSPREFAANLRQMLTSNPELLTDETAAELQELLEKPVKRRRGEFNP